MIGRLTTRKVGQIARLTIKHALGGRRGVIPGFIYQLMRRAPGFIHLVLLSKMLGRLRRNARKNRLDLKPDSYHFPDLTRV